MQFRILREIIYSEEFVRFELDNFYDEFFPIIETLQLPLLSRIKEFYGQDVDFGSLEIEPLKKEIEIVITKVKNPETLSLLNNLKKLAEQATEEKKGLSVLTD